MTDAVTFVWGSDNKTGPAAPGLGGSVPLFGQLFPTYDLPMIAFGPLVALLLGLVAVAILLPALAVIAATGFLLPVALIGLAGLLLAAGGGLAMLREGPLWPRRPNRLVYAAYLILPPALEVGLIITAAAGLGAALHLPARRRAPAD